VDNIDDPADQFAWLDNTLKSALTANEKVKRFCIYYSHLRQFEKKIPGKSQSHFYSRI
jgi:hypothetical protein